MNMMPCLFVFLVTIACASPQRLSRQRQFPFKQEITTSNRSVQTISNQPNNEAIADAGIGRSSQSRFTSRSRSFLAGKLIEPHTRSNITKEQSTESPRNVNSTFRRLRNRGRSVIVAPALLARENVKQETNNSSSHNRDFAGLSEENKRSNLINVPVKIIVEANEESKNNTGRDEAAMEHAMDDEKLMLPKEREHNKILNEKEMPLKSQPLFIPSSMQNGDLKKEMKPMTLEEFDSSAVLTSFTSHDNLEIHQDSMNPIDQPPSTMANDVVNTPSPPRKTTSSFTPFRRQFRPSQRTPVSQETSTAATPAQNNLSSRRGNIRFRESKAHLLPEERGIKVSKDAHTQTQTSRARLSRGSRQL